MRVEYKKTSELTEFEIQKICTLFSELFIGHTKLTSQFINQFSNNEFGFSYHGMLINDIGEIVGSQSYIPYYYFVDGKKNKVALSVDTMILDNYRNMPNIFNLWKNGHNRLIHDGFIFIFGFPNENAYLLRIKGLKDVDVGNLPTYILPCRIGSLKPKLKYFDFLIKLFARGLIFFSNLSNSTEVYKFRIQRCREKFDYYRYKWFDGNYEIFSTINYKIVYRIKMHNSFNTAFILDIYPMNKKNFDEGIRYVFQKERNNIDLIIYVGFLHFRPLSMIKIPKKIEPKKFHFTLTLLDKSIDKSRFNDISNWDINLASFDLI
jgi:hypothetical protein